MTVFEKLQALRAVMAERGMDAYIVPTEDFHGSEYVGEYFKAREYLSGFTGSAGTLAVLPDFAGLWTDGRYFLQAGEQLAGTPVTLMKAGEPGIPSPESFLASRLPENAVIGFDGRTLSRRFTDSLTNAFGTKPVRLDGTEDLVGRIWPDRPALSCQPVWELPEHIAGKSRAEKLREVRVLMTKHSCDLLPVSSLAEIAWLLNLRGNDVECTPVFLSHLILTMDEALLFAQKEQFSSELISRLLSDGVRLLPYGDMEKTLRELSARKAVWADPEKLSWSIFNAVSSAASCTAVSDPIDAMKAVKNAAEQEGMKAAHLKDAIACTRFLFWLKKQVGKLPMTELSAAEKLLSFRKEQEGFLEPSFDTILAYGPHAAVVHYSPSPQTDCPLEPKGLCLIDSGAHYTCGTTDITRTVVLGPLSPEEKKAFTLVLKGHLALGSAKFRHGTTGGALDILAREPLWREGMDFNHGTGHGVGFVLPVHEGPQRIRYGSGSGCNVVLENGMIFSDEPGYYEDHRFGIRHENLVLVQGEPDERFHSLLPLTLVPFDREGIDLSLFSEEDCRLLNEYHEKVQSALLPYLQGEERDWLMEVTEPLAFEKPY